MIMKLMEKRIDLNEQLGVKDLAWKYKDIVEVIKSCKDNNLFIYGGDVLAVNKNGDIDFTYDNWSTDHINTENCIKAAEFSLNYINSYPNKEDFIFTIVILGINQY
jgi:hypothetical protein